MRKHREKDPYTYKAEIRDGKEYFSVAFKDGQGNQHEISVSREIFFALRQLQNTDNKRAYKDEFYLSHFVENADDDEFSSMTFSPISCVEDAVITSETDAAISELLSTLTDKQERRFLLSALDGKSEDEIAKIENCSRIAVHYSISSAKAKLKKLFKNFPDCT